MRSRITFGLACGLVLFAATTSARHHPPTARPVPHRPTGSSISLDAGLGAAAVQETTWLATYTFDQGGSCISEGWTSHDITEQLDIFWHVDDFAAMGPNYQGHVGVLAGTRSLWLGARASTTSPLCGYAALPGYGNNWDQVFQTTGCVDTGPGAVVQFAFDWDCEPNYDATTLEMSNCTGGQSDEDWIVLAGGIGAWDGNLDGDTLISIAIPDSLHGAVGENALAVRLRFTSDGAWSDEDGLWDTDGVTVDDLSLTGLPVETFESEAVGATATLSGNWAASATEGYGDYAALYSGATLLQEDGCENNPSCMWAFISGSTADYGCGGHPGQPAVPYQNTRGQFIENEIWSPAIPLAGSGSRYELAFDVYRDLPIDPLVFYQWHIRSIDASGCAGLWRDRNYVFFGSDQDWYRDVSSVGDLIEADAVSVQVSLGVIDMCKFWCGVFGTGSCHSHAPLFDNVDVYRIDLEGPQWSVRDIDLFQDTFAGDGTTTGTARIDAAIDILPSEYVNIRPGDSTVVRVADPENGLALDASGWAAVYAYVHVDGPTGEAVDAMPGILTENTFRWPYTTTIQDGTGNSWHALRMDTSFVNGATRAGPQPHTFCVDLNDDLFVPGDTIQFVFAAFGALPVNEVSYWTPFTGATSDEAAALASPAECTVLPAGGWARGGEILYVDGMNGRGAQPYIDGALQQLAILDEVDRYDIRGPSSNTGNRPGARVVDPLQQLLPCYRFIIWDTGNLDDGLIGDGTPQVEKSNDALMLLTFLDNLELPGGVYFSGDNIAEEWPFYSGSAIVLRDTYIQHTLVDGNHADQGIVISPRVIGEPNASFDHLTGPDTLIAYGGCPVIGNFDVLAPTAASVQEMRYDGAAPGANGAVISQYTLNPDSTTVGVVLSGFSFQSIRDHRPGGPPARAHHLEDLLYWFSILYDVSPSAGPIGATTLGQNYPNPFNPVTTIEFSLEALSPVSVTIYNVRGQRVRTLAEGRFEPGVTHRVEWDGRNDAGQQVSSGVYFYRLVAKDFSQTRKMVLLK